MEADFNIIDHKKKFFLILILFSFSLFSFNTNNKEIKFEKNNTTLEKEITIVITKKTTKEELETIKKEITDQGLGFTYSNVIYNDKNEIVAISIYYKDLNNNSGNYSVSSQKPINNIVIVSEGTRISVKSEGSSNQAFINQGSGKRNKNNSDKLYEDRKRDMSERSKLMEKEMKDRMQAMKKRHSQMASRMEKRRDNLSKQSPIEEYKGNYHIITKNTTDSDLLEIQKIFESENISFNYKNLQRNDEGEVTHISITVDNQNGSISTSGFGNGSDAIKKIQVAVDEKHIIMRIAE